MLLCWKHRIYSRFIYDLSFVHLWDTKDAFYNFMYRSMYIEINKSLWIWISVNIILTELFDRWKFKINDTETILTQDSVQTKQL